MIRIPIQKSLKDLRKKNLALESYITHLHQQQNCLIARNMLETIENHLSLQIEGTSTYTRKVLWTKALDIPHLNSMFLQFQKSQGSGQMIPKSAFANLMCRVYSILSQKIHSSPPAAEFRRIEQIINLPEFKILKRSESSALGFVGSSFGYPVEFVKKVIDLPESTQEAISLEVPKVVQPSADDCIDYRILLVLIEQKIFARLSGSRLEKWTKSKSSFKPKLSAALRLSKVEPSNLVEDIVRIYLEALPVEVEHKVESDIFDNKYTLESLSKEGTKILLHESETLDLPYCLIIQEMATLFGLETCIIRLDYNELRENTEIIPINNSDIEKTVSDILSGTDESKFETDSKNIEALNLILRKLTNDSENLDLQIPLKMKQTDNSVISIPPKNLVKSAASKNPLSSVLDFFTKSFTAPMHTTPVALYVQYT